MQRYASVRYRELARVYVAALYTSRYMLIERAEGSTRGLRHAHGSNGRR